MTEVYDAIVAQNPQLSKKTKMKEHFKALYEYCYNVKRIINDISSEECTQEPQYI
jgi:hypothetical protein